MGNKPQGDGKEQAEAWLQDPRRASYPILVEPKVGEYSKAEARAWEKYALKIFESEPEQVKKSLKRLFAVTMTDLGINEYEIAYKLGRTVEWVNAVVKRAAKEDDLFSFFIDKRVRNGKARLTSELYQIAKWIVERRAKYGVKAPPKMARELAEALTQDGRPTSYKQSLQINRYVAAIEAGTKLYAVSKEITLSYRYLEVMRRLVDSNGKPLRINPKTLKPYLTADRTSKR